MSLFAGSAEELVFKATNNYQYDKVIYSVKIQHIYILIYIVLIYIWLCINDYIYIIYI